MNVKKLLKITLGFLFFATSFKSIPVKAEQPKDETKYKPHMAKNKITSLDNLKKNVKCGNFNQYCDNNPIFQGNDHSSH